MTENTVNRFHCCATCKYYLVVKELQRTNFQCSRLGFDTKPTYQFQCWDPKEQVKKLMKRS